MGELWPDSPFPFCQELQPLPALRSLSFYDVHFGTSPVTALDGYRDYVLCTLPQITELDGHEVPRVALVTHECCCIAAANATPLR